MSKIQIEIPDNGWFHRESPVRPQDKQLCVVILNQGSKIPRIFQYREDMNNDFCFLDIENCVDYFEYEIAPDDAACYASFHMQDIYGCSHCFFILKNSKNIVIKNILNLQYSCHLELSTHD